VELDEALALIQTQKASLDALGGEKDSMKAKMDQLLTETKTAKTDKREFETKFSTLTTEFEEFKTNSTLDAESKQKIDELVAQRVESAQSKFEENITTMQEQLDTSQGSYTKLKTQYDQERIGGALRKSAEAAGVIPSAIDDVISRAHGVFSVSEENAIESRDSDGNLRKIGKKIASPDVFVDSLKESAPHLWPASKGGGSQGAKGSGSDGGVNPFAKDTINYTAQALLKKSDPDKAARLQKAATG